MATILNSYQNPDGTPVANGYLLVSLNQAASSGLVQLSVAKVKVLLNASGAVIGSPTFAASSTLEPTTAYYILEVYAADGQQLSYPTILVL
jgi:hypothetical protein